MRLHSDEQKLLHFIKVAVQRVWKQYVRKTAEMALTEGLKFSFMTAYAGGKVSEFLFDI